MNYPSKLLLFGEYLVIRSGQALAVPYEKYGGQWSFGPARSTLQQDLQDLSNYLFVLSEKNELLCRLDVQRFSEDLKRGLFFDSKIPAGYGLGSSGALCAALYDRYVVEGKISKDDAQQFGKLRLVLSQIESYFHGSSSGIDPLISYLNKGVILNKNGGVELLKPCFGEEGHRFFLLDTNITRQTAPLVDLFLEKCKNADYLNQIEEELMATSDAAIINFLKNNWVALAENFRDISALQFGLFQEMIPESYRNIWMQGLETGDFNLKLCGAGGGGFLLGYTNEMDKCRIALQGRNWEVIK